MSRAEAHEKLDYLKSLAEQGANTPLLGGRIGLIWTILLVPTLIIHGAIVTGVFNATQNTVGMLWMLFGITGGILSFLLSRNLNKKPGAGSIGNKIESIIWPTQALLIFAFAIAIVVGTSINKFPAEIINTIMPFAFALATINLILLGRVTQQKYLFYAGIVSAIFMVFTALLVVKPEVYYVSAVGVLLSGVLPNLIQMRKERN